MCAKRSEKSQTDADDVRSRIASLVGKTKTRQLVAEYFDDKKGFASTTFNALRPNDPFEFRVVDFYAVSTLDVHVTPAAARRLLGSDHDAIEGHLLEIPVDLPLWEATASDLAGADAIWKLLCKGRDGLGWVTAGKLLARKRPHLVPVLDDVVVTNLCLPRKGTWSLLRTVLLHEGLRADIEGLRPTALTPLVPTLRLLDVAAWMTDGEGKRAKASRRRAEWEPDQDLRPL